MNNLITKILVSATCCGFAIGQASAWAGGVETPFGKNQFGISPPFAFNNIWPFLNLTKGPGTVTRVATSPALSSALWSSTSGGTVTFTTSNAHGFYTGSPQSRWAVQVQGVTGFTGYNVNFTTNAGAFFTATSYGTTTIHLVVSLGTVALGSNLVPQAGVIVQGVPDFTRIVSQTNGPTGGTGDYVTNNATTTSGDSLLTTNACTITGTNTFTCPMATSPGGSVSNRGVANFILDSSAPPNTPNSSWGQGNNIYQYFDADGDIQPDIADLAYVNRIYYIWSSPFPARYTRTGQPLTLDWTGDPTIRCGHGAPPYRAGNTNSWIFGADNNTDPFVCFYNNDTQRRNPAKNLRLYLTANQAAINRGEIFEPVYVNMLKQGAGLLRFMDYLETNNSPVLTYSTFATEAYRQWADSGVPGVASAPYGSPISIITRLANQTNKHPWINVPNRLGTPKFATIKSMTRSLSAGATTVVMTTYTHNFVAGDTVIPYNVDGDGTSNSGWGKQSTVTINPTNATVTWSGHAFVAGQNVVFEILPGNSGVLPSVTGQSTDIGTRSFYVTNPNTGAGTFQLAATPAAAQAGTVVSLSGSASGTITGLAIINRNAFVIGSNNLTANTFELTNCDSSNFGATLPTTGNLTSPFSLSGMTTEVGNLANAIKGQLNSQLVPRFEFSNEMWNPIFDAFHWNAAQAHNFVDTLGNPIFPHDDSNKMAGYLAAHVMKTVRDVYGGAGSRALWRGNLATWWGMSGWTTSLVSGVNYYLANYAPASGLVLTDLFNDVATTGYYGNIWYSNGFFGNYSNVTVSIRSPATVKPASGTASFAVGTPIIFSNSGGALPGHITPWSASNLASFNGTIAGNTLTVNGSVTGTPLAIGQHFTGAGVSTTTITAGSGTSWTISGSAQNVSAEAMFSYAVTPTYGTGVYWVKTVDTGSGFTFTDTNNNGVLGAAVDTTGDTQSGTQTVQTANASLINNWMNDSYAHFINQDGNYPTKYSYFNTMVNLEVGDGRFLKNPYAVSLLAANWTNNIVAGLGMVQYEGGNGNYVNSTPPANYLAANGTQYVFDPQTKEYFSYAFATQEDAANWTGMVNAWNAFGAANSITVGYPSKYVEATNVAYSNSLLASFGANYYVDHFQGVGTSVPGNPLWGAIVNTN
jgi:hypothetical protein